MSLGDYCFVSEMGLESERRGTRQQAGRREQGREEWRRDGGDTSSWPSPTPGTN